MDLREQAMFEITLLALPECMAAVRAMLESAPAGAKGRMAFAVVNEHGELMAFARMDGASPAVSDFALKKAYTSARMRTDLKAFRAGLEQRGRTVADYGDPKLVGMAAGGVAIAAGDGVIGAIGVSGGTPDEDEQVARTGLATILSRTGADHA
jgi:glc operon protein GlcG